MSRQPNTIEQRTLSFLTKITFNFTTGCWLWNGARSSERYGVFRVGTKVKYAHRLAYEATHGPIPEGHDIHHEVCETRHCVNPEHMVTMPLAEHRAMTLKRGA